MFRKKYATVAALGALVTCGADRPSTAIVPMRCETALPEIEPLASTEGPHVGPFLLDIEDDDMTILSMNVQRLPFKANPDYRDDRIACLSKLSEKFDLVAYQENFMGWWKNENSESRAYTSFNSGLSFYANMSFTKIGEKKYSLCNGSIGEKNDCLAEKGFQEIKIKGVPLFNTHLDAGDSLNDIMTRELQLAKILLALPAHGRVIVVGDFNLKRNRDEDEASYRAFLSQSGLQEIARSADGVDVILGRGVKARAVATIGNELLSDHKGLVAALSLS